MTREEALEIARHYHLEEEVEFAMNQGMTPEEALSEWDMFPYEPATDPTSEEWTSIYTRNCRSGSYYSFLVHHQQQDEVPSLQFTGLNFIAEILLRAEREILLQR